MVPIEEKRPGCGKLAAANLQVETKQRANTVDGCEIHKTHHRSETLVSDDSPVNANKQFFQPWFSKWCRILSIHSMSWFFRSASRVGCSYASCRMSASSYRDEKPCRELAPQVRVLNPPSCGLPRNCRVAFTSECRTEPLALEENIGANSATRVLLGCAHQLNGGGGMPGMRDPTSFPLQMPHPLPTKR